MLDSRSCMLERRERTQPERAEEVESSMVTELEGRSGVGMSEGARPGFLQRQFPEPQTVDSVCSKQCSL